MADHVDRAAVHHGDGTVRGDRGGGEIISKAILKSELKFIIPSDSPKEKSVWGYLKLPLSAQNFSCD